MANINRREANMKDPCANSNMLTLAVAKARLLRRIDSITAFESVQLLEALNRVLACDIRASIQVPAFDNAAMDGYALAQADKLDIGSRFLVVGQSHAGEPFSKPLQAGECVRIMTGAVIPIGTCAVVAQEKTERQAQYIELTAPVKFDANIRKTGEDIADGQLLFRAGHKLNPVDLGLLASIGVVEVDVTRIAKVAVFSTGNELQQQGFPLQIGQIYESNRFVLLSKLKQLGFEAIDMGIVGDSAEAIEAAFIEADSFADAVISSGGVSVGDSDLTKSVLSEIGEPAFWQVAIKPGKPFAFGRLSNSWFFGLPGNPVSSCITFEQLVAPALAVLSGQSMGLDHQLIFNVVCQSEITRKAGRVEFVRGIAATNDEGELQVTALTKQGAGVLSSISNANCYVVMDAEVTHVKRGDTVAIELFDSIN